MQSCAVIGCGAAGMAASMALRRSGLLVTCFELAPDPGGVWNSDTRSSFSTRGLISPLHPTLRCVLPKDLLAFSDMRFDYTVPQFPHHSSVRRYLDRYAASKGVGGLVRFNTKVQSVRYDATSAVWHIITVNVVNGDVFEWAFDKVCVCTGQAHEPRYPEGLKELLVPYVESGGELHHAFHVKDFRQFKNKRVVVVGDDVTAWDYCWDLKRCGADVYHSGCSFPDEGHFSDSCDESGLIKGSYGTNMRDIVSAAVQLLSRTPGWRKDVARGNKVVSNWLRFRNGAILGRLSNLGQPIGCEGKGILFSNECLGKVEVLKEMRACSMAGKALGYSDLPQSVFMDNVDAVICATGYHRRYPFLHEDIREVLEKPTCFLPQKGNKCADDTSANATKAVDHRSLYLGTLFAPNPSIGFVGMQKELLPPFLLFEAQSKFVAYAFTHRLNLPNDAAGLLARQEELMRRYPLLANLYAPYGLGLYSALYFNVLQEELQVGARDTYTSAIMERQKWILLTGLLRLVHKARSLAPLKRKQQHILFSNTV